jgi:toxin ParE1/3/4
MKGVVRPRREAQQDLVDIFRHIARKAGLGAARRFLASAEATMGRLASLPRSGALFEPGEPRFAGLRYLPVSRFRNYLIFYRPAADGIEVLRVLHGSRDLGSLLAADPGDEAPGAG